MNTKQIKVFAISNQMLERDLDTVEKAFHLELGRDDRAEESRDEEYYPQFNETVRHEAASMAEHYEIFYCLEKSIRDLIRDRLNGEKGAAWWDTAVPETVRSNVTWRRT